MRFAQPFKRLWRLLNGDVDRHFAEVHREVLIAQKDANWAKNFISKSAQISVNLGFKQNHTVIVCSTFNNKDFVQIYQVKPEETKYLINMLNEMRKAKVATRVDEPVGYSFESFLY